MSVKDQVVKEKTGQHSTAARMRARPVGRARQHDYTGRKPASGGAGAAAIGAKRR